MTRFPVPDDPDDLIGALVADLQPVRPLRQRDGMAAALLALSLVVAASITLFAPRADLVAGHPHAAFALSSLLFLALAQFSTWITVAAARPAAGERRQGLALALLLAAVLPGTALVVMAIDWMDGNHTVPEADGLRCLSYGVLWGLLTAGVLVGWLRRGAPVRAGRAGWTAGIAAGSAGAFAVSLVCPEVDLVHIGTWHGGTVLLCGLLGRLIIPRLIAW